VPWPTGTQPGRLTIGMRTSYHVGLGAVLYPTPSAGASISTLGDAGTSYAAYDAEYPYAGVGVLG
jgi:hypothetical protein